MAIVSSQLPLTASEDHVGVADDRRCVDRVAVTIGSTLLGLRSSKTIACTVRNISAGGVYLHADERCGVQVGQRFEISAAKGVQAGGLASSLQDGCFATVVRTAVAEDGSQKVLAAGLRFDQPILGFDQPLLV